MSDCQWYYDDQQWDNRSGIKCVCALWVQLCNESMFFWSGAFKLKTHWHAGDENNENCSHKRSNNNLEAPPMQHQDRHKKQMGIWEYKEIMRNPFTANQNKMEGWPYQRVFLYLYNRGGFPVTLGCLIMRDHAKTHQGLLGSRMGFPPEGSVRGADSTTSVGHLRPQLISVCASGGQKRPGLAEVRISF